jgi:N-acetylglucosaminyl-diphospho-decaprenol L-rhamnosyltransferase
MSSAAPGAGPVPDLSVIILSYNTSALTCACVAATLRDAAAAAGTSALAVEVIVVDNASSDDTLAALRAAFPQLALIANAANLGFARGNNAGLAAARGRYRLLLNSDTEAQPGALRALVGFMDLHPEAGACGPMLLNADGSLQPSGRDLPSVWSVFAGMTRLYRLWRRDFYLQPDRDYEQSAQVGEVSGAALLVSAEAYRRVGGLDPNLFAYYEDVDWCKRIGQAGFRVYYVPEARVVHRWHGTSAGASELAYRAGQDSLRYYFAKHHGRLAQAAIQGLLALKELARLAAAALRRQPEAARFHSGMLRNVFAPLAPAVAKDEADV